MRNGGTDGAHHFFCLQVAYAKVLRVTTLTLARIMSMDAALFDATSIDFGAPTKLGSSQQMIIPLSTVTGRFDWNTRICLQFGKDQDNMLTSQYGVSVPLQGQDPTKLNLDIVPDAALEASMRALDAAVVDYCSKHSEELFKSKTLLKQHCPILKDKTAEGGGVSLRVKVVVEADKPTTGTFPVTTESKAPKLTEVRSLNEEKTKIKKCDHRAVIRDSEVIVVAKTPGIWYNASQFGVSFTADSIIVKPPSTKQGLGVFNLLPGVTEVEDGSDGEVGDA